MTVSVILLLKGSSVASSALKMKISRLLADSTCQGLSLFTQISQSLIPSKSFISRDKGGVFQ